MSFLPSPNLVGKQISPIRKKSNRHSKFQKLLKRCFPLSDCASAAAFGHHITSNEAKRILVGPSLSASIPLLLQFVPPPRPNHQILPSHLLAAAVFRRLHPLLLKLLPPNCLHLQIPFSTLLPAPVFVLFQLLLLTPEYPLAPIWALLLRRLLYCSPSRSDLNSGSFSKPEIRLGPPHLSHWVRLTGRGLRVMAVPPPTPCLRPLPLELH